MISRKSIDDIVNADLGSDPDLPEIPEIDLSDPEAASTAYSQHRTKLSTHRTALSNRRTGMSTDRTEMSKRRTGLSFQRSRMSAERTLMSVIRTALSLISFGFTIYQFFQHLQEKSVLEGGTHAARNFGLALVYLGVGMLVVGIVYHLQFMGGLRQERRIMMGDGLIHAQSAFPISFTLVVAVLLLLLGIVAGTNLTFQIGPFG
ncbi:MAG TPA: DUF202 domain-containing protein [Rhizomicrobium sp.]|jgi:uncharacterized membrane protein YidH (DUF202 family)